MTYAEKTKKYAYICIVKKYLIAFCVLLFVMNEGSAQVDRLAEDVEYGISATGIAGSGDDAPFWFVSNRYGLIDNQDNQGVVRARIQRDVKADSLRKWRIGYGLDLAVPINQESKFILQQAYADFQYKAMRLSVGQKERPLELKNQALSSGGQVTGINARPIPQIRIELPEFWTIPRTGDWLAVKAHIAYGAYTDNRWQRKFNNSTNNLYTANSRFHSKAGFVQIGNTQKFPVTLTGGFEMSCQFAGDIWNMKDYGGHNDPNFTPDRKLPNGLKTYWNAFIPGGNDLNDGDFYNAEGNQIGSYHLSIAYHGHGWDARFYAEHMFEDHSQLFWQYGWKDMLYGGELTLPRNRFVSTLLYEHLRTTDQSGGIYHDATSTMPIQLSGIDNYYNNHVYGAWQHSGHVMGTPLIISPLYNTGGEITCMDNRVVANHIGLSGNPTSEISYRALFTHEKSLGTYSQPRTNPRYGQFLLVEATYAPHRIAGLSFTAAYGQNRGTLIGRSRGGMLTVAYNGRIKRNKR